MNDDQIKYLVNRFLGWKLPENFSPDGGISFKKTFNDHMPTPSKNEPTGTNLFDATQATAMIRYLVEGLPESSQSNVLPTSHVSAPMPLVQAPRPAIAPGVYPDKLKKGNRITLEATITGIADGSVRYLADSGCNGWINISDILSISLPRLKIGDEYTYTGASGTAKVIGIDEDDVWVKSSSGTFETTQELLLTSAGFRLVNVPGEMA